MADFPRKYIVDENNQKIAVQLDISTFSHIEEILENYALVELMKQNQEGEKLSLADAKTHYGSLEKPK